MQKYHQLIATGFGSGLFPIAPGTAGSSLALLLSVLLFAFVPLPTWMFFGLAINIFLPLGLLFAVLSFPSVSWYIKHSGENDPSAVVADEISGQWIALGFLPVEYIPQNLWVFLAAFALFRLFDILKPLGIRRAETLPGALGVLADDILAGFYAALVLWVLTFSVR